MASPGHVRRLGSGCEVEAHTLHKASRPEQQGCRRGLKGALSVGSMGGMGGRLAIFAVCAVLLLPLTSAAAAAPIRATYDINAGWRFFRAPQTRGASFPSRGYSDRTWPAVSLPHTWNNIDGMDGGTYYQGEAWYRRWVSLPANFKGKRIFLHFGAAAITSTVYVNEKLVGTHRGGYTAFRYDITAALGSGLRGLVAVKITNLDRTVIPLIPPRGSARPPDYTIYGGLYRKAYIFGVNPISFSMMDYGGPGVYVRQQSISTAKSTLLVTGKVTNNSGKFARGAMRIAIYNALGKVIWSGRSKATGFPVGTTVVQMPVVLLRPRLWNGVKDPYMYTVQATLVSAFSGGTWDATSVPLGLRSFWVDKKNGGFFLNGAKYPIRGVNKHQDWDKVGSAITETHMAYDLGLVKEIGATAVRSHFPLHPFWYASCSKAGIINMPELPLVNTIPTSPDNPVNQFREMIRQNYNSPSILFWGIANELLMFSGTQAKKYIPLLTKLHQTAKLEDPQRLTVYAHRLSDGLDNKLSPTDIIGWNSYARTVSSLTQVASKLSWTPKMSAVTELGGGGQLALQGPVYGASSSSEPDQCLALETQLPFYTRTPQYWGHFIYTLHDQGSDERLWGVARKGVGTSGLVTLNHMIKKDSFYFVKAFWSTNPMVFIANKRYNPRPRKGTLKVYCNQKAGVTLTVNGKSLGKPTKVLNGVIYLWLNVVLPGPTAALRATSRTAQGQPLVDSAAFKTR